MPVTPLPCASCGGGDTAGPGQPAFDAEQQLLCDVGPDGEILGTAIMVTLYDEGSGNPAGPPTPVNPATGDPYVVLGTLQACPGDLACHAPQQFCFASTATTDEPGRMYDLAFTMGLGFGVQGIIRDLVDTPVSIVWQVTDPTAANFTADLQSALQSQFPGQTVTVNAVGTDPCGGTGDFTIHIECLRLDQTPPTLLQLRYNNGRDLVQNAAFATTPPQPAVNAPLSFVKRSDGVAPVATADVDCTAVANRGWESNDKSQVFELWGPPGSIQNTITGITPTPRGTAVQEINAFGSGPTPVAGGAAGNPAFGQNPDTLWQTFVVPAPGNFNIRVVVGARGGIGAPAVENIPIKLSTGDVGDAGIGDIINTSVNAPRVTSAAEGGPGPYNQPWTTFSQVVPLAAGTYTLAFTGPVQQDTPGGNNAFGGLFTDMRVFADAPNTIADFANDDDTCTVPVSSTSTVCEFWAPRCSGGEIVGWRNVADGEELTNAAFWAQVPAPTCCTPEVQPGGGGTTGNLIHTYLVCGTTETGQRTLSRVVISDQAGAPIAETFVDTNGALVTPTFWQPGQCPDATALALDSETQLLCDVQPGDVTVQFLRRLAYNPDGTLASTLDTGLNGVTPYAVVGNVALCGSQRDVEMVLLCDFGAAGAPFLRAFAYDESGFVVSTSDTQLDGQTAYLPVGPVGVCVDPVVPEVDFAEQVLCDDNGPFTRRTTIVHGIGTDVTDYLLDGETVYATVGAVVVCPNAVRRDVEVEILCDNNGAFIRVYQFGDDTGTQSGAPSDLTLAGALYVPVGPIVHCGQAAGRDVEVQVLCDTVGPFIRVYQFNDQSGLQSGVPNDLTLAGGPYVTVGAVGICNPALTPYDSRDAEILVLCDATPTRFLRKYLYDGETGAFTTVVNTTLDGTTPFVPVGAVGVCSVAVQSDFDFLSTVLCDANGTQFIQRLTFNSSTGAVTSTTNTTLTGGAFVPVGAVSLCTSCCPIQLGTGCYNAGSGRYTSLRLANGTISLIDSVTGAAVLPASIIACPTDDAVKTLTAQARLLTNAAPWTPGGDVAGTLTALTVTGVSGLWDVVDQNGTALVGIPAGVSMSWSVDDDNTLTGPTSVTPQAGASVVANWTQR